jgi:hypothetical protein
MFHHIAWTVLCNDFFVASFNRCNLSTMLGALIFILMVSITLNHLAITTLLWLSGISLC